MIEYGNNLKTLNSDTDNIIEYIENSQIKDKKKYRFWELLINDKEFIDETLGDYEDSGKLHTKAEAARQALGKQQAKQKEQMLNNK